MFTDFTGYNIASIRKILFHYKTYILCLLMFYKNIHKIIYKVIGTMIYCIMEKCVCLYYLFSIQDRLSKF